MADAHAIEHVSKALKQVLQTQLGPLGFGPGTVSVESIDLLPDPVPKPRVTLFLYNVHEDPHLKNRGDELVATGPGAVRVRPPPIVVDLDYMVCAWMVDTEEEHRVLGHILRALHDHAQLEAAALGPTWRPEESVQVTLANPTIEDQARIWTTFGFKRFKLALYYRARVIPISSEREYGERRVAARNATPRAFTPPSPGDLPPGVP